MPAAILNEAVLCCLSPPDVGRGYAIIAAPPATEETRHQEAGAAAVRGVECTGEKVQAKAACSR